MHPIDIRRLDPLYAAPYQLQDFFTDDQIKKRTRAARRHVLNVVRFATHPPCGAGKNSELWGLSRDIESFIRFVDVRGANRGSYRKLFREEEARTVSHASERIDAANWMRHELVQLAVELMYSRYEINFVGETWTVLPSVLDKHRRDPGTRKPTRRPAKRDDRSFHGRPNRDRGKPIFVS